MPMLTRCIAKLITAVLPCDAVDATSVAITCCSIVRRVSDFRPLVTYLLYSELARVYKLQEGTKLLKSSPFD